MTQIELRGVQKFFGAVQVIKDLNLKIDDNEFIVLLGQSGCGKTTTLRAIAGPRDDRRGRHPDRRQAGAASEGVGPRHRHGVPVVLALSAHERLREHRLPAAGHAHEQGARSTAAVREVAKVLRITDLLGKKPSALSGGDMQRVAIGRALVRRPKAMLMDEPIGALDAKLREEMRAEIKRLHMKQGSTTIYVTHDQIEAMSLADRIVIMHEGVLQQVGSPSEVYAHPTNMFVARFVGSPVMNIVNASVSGQRRRRERHRRRGGRRVRLPWRIVGQARRA